MNKVFITLVCVIALLANAYFGYFGWAPEENNGGNGNGNGDGNGHGDDEDGDDDDDDDDDDVISEFITVELTLDERETVKIENESHRITVLSIDGETVLLRIESDPIEVELHKGRSKKVMIEGEHYLKIKVTGISEDTVTLEIRSFEKMSVYTPPMKLHAEYEYDFELFAELYWKNYTTGNYSKYTVDSDGSWRDTVAGPLPVESGYGDKHDCILERHEMDGLFTLILDSSETGKISVDGEFSADNMEYVELEEGKTIKSENDGKMEVKYLPKAKIQIPVSYDGTIRYYPEPTDEQLPTVGEQIYVDKTIKEGDSGSIFYPGSSEQSAGYYNWTAEKGETIKVGREKKEDVETLLLNITSNFYYNFDFKRLAWISNDHHYIIKELLRTNVSYEDDEGIFWFIFEERRTLLEYTRGSEEIPWVEDGVAEYPEKHETGEYESWNMVPRGGSMFDGDPKTDDMTVQMAPEDALSFARENSAGLTDFLKQYPDAYIGQAKYNATLQTPKANDKLGSHVWNFSFQEFMDGQEARDFEEKHDKWPEKRYTLRVAKNVSKEINPLTPEEYRFDQEVDKDYGKLEGYSNFKRSEIASNGLTLSGALDIIKTDPDALKELFDGDGELVLEDLAISVGEGATAEEAPGTEIVEALTGLNMPYTKYTWTFQRASLYEAGDTFIISVDVETGRLVQVTRISGTQIMGMFD